MKAAATELGMDAAAFGMCLDSGKRASEWQKNMEAGKKLGVNAK